MIETIWQDVKFALRLLFKDRWISAAAITALALGIGVNAVGFTIVNTAFFRGLPVSLFAVLAFIALTLSSVGLYAVMSYAVAQRTQEIGVRVAIGAQPGQVAWLVLRRGLRQLLFGLAIGLSSAWALSIVMADLLVEVRPGDPATLTSIAILMSVVSIAACLIPARRPTRVDPVIALRAE